MSFRGFVGLVAIAALATSAASGANAQAPIQAVATFSILGDMVAAIGGNRVAVTSLVGPDEDAHAFEPGPNDLRAVAAAGIVFANGLGFEGWIDRLVAASGYRGAVVVATDGIEPNHLEDDDHAVTPAAADDHAHEAVDPHAWQSLANARVYASNIASALTTADPAGAAIYAANLTAYLGEIDAIAAEARAAFAAIAPERRVVVTSHDAFGYFAEENGLTFLAPLGLTTDAEPTAGTLAALIGQIRDVGAGAVFIEAMTDPRLVEQIARETGATVGGTLYSDALSGPEGPAPTYLAMMRYNIRTIALALGGTV